LYATGINVEDSLRLCVGEIDLKRRRIEIEKSSRSRRREIPIGDDLAKKISEYLRSRRGVATSQHLFATLDGRQVPYAVVRTAFVRLRRLAGISRADSNFQPRILDLRHTFVVNSLTRLIGRGYPMPKALPMVTAYVGSTDLKNFVRYADLVPHAFRGQLRRLANAVTHSA
jgi:integrase